MPLKSVVMAVVLSGWLLASAIAFMLVAYTSFFGIAVIGLMIWFICTRLDLERESSFTHQVTTKPQMSQAERVALRSETALEAQTTRFFRHFGMALVLIGAGGFLYFQL